MPDKKQPIVDIEIITAYQLFNLGSMKPKERNNVIRKYLEEQGIYMEKADLSRKVYNLICRHKQYRGFHDMRAPLPSKKPPQKGPQYVSCTLCKKNEGGKFMALFCGHIVHIDCWDKHVSTTTYDVARRCTICDSLTPKSDEKPIYL